MFDQIIQRVREMGSPGMIMSGSKDEGALIGGVKPQAQPPGRGFFVERRTGTRLVQVALLDDGSVPATGAARRARRGRASGARADLPSAGLPPRRPGGQAPAGRSAQATSGDRWAAVAGTSDPAARLPARQRRRRPWLITMAPQSRPARPRRASPR